jgi:hypothetical protein
MSIHQYMRKHVLSFAGLAAGSAFLLACPYPPPPPPGVGARVETYYTERPTYVEPYDYGGYYAGAAIEYERPNYFDSPRDYYVDPYYDDYGVRASVSIPVPPVVLPPEPQVVFSASLGFGYVPGLHYPVYYTDGYFYTYYDDRWYCTPRPRYGWAAIEPAYLPRPIIHNETIIKNTIVNKTIINEYFRGEPRRISSFQDRYPGPVEPQRIVYPDPRRYGDFGKIREERRRDFERIAREREPERRRGEDGRRIEERREREAERRRDVERERERQAGEQRQAIERQREAEREREREVQQQRERQAEEQRREAERQREPERKGRR